MLLKCYPICECGHVFEKLASWTETVEVSKNYAEVVRKFNPDSCPKCGKQIDKIELPKEGYSGVILFDRGRME